MAEKSVTISYAALELGVLDSNNNTTITVMAEQTWTESAKPFRIHVGFDNYSFTITGQTRYKLVKIFVPEFQQHPCCRPHKCILKKIEKNQILALSVRMSVCSAEVFLNAASPPATEDVISAHQILWLLLHIQEIKKVKFEPIRRAKYDHLLRKICYEQYVIHQPTTEGKYYFDETWVSEV